MFSHFIPLDIRWINNLSHQNDKPGEIIIDNHHKGSVEGDSQWNGEVKVDVGSTPTVQLCLFHFQRDFLRTLRQKMKSQCNLFFRCTMIIKKKKKKL